LREAQACSLERDNLLETLKLAAAVDPAASVCPQRLQESARLIEAEGAAAQTRSASDVPNVEGLFHATSVQVDVASTSSTIFADVRV
jgi:hypothetical protein